MFEDAFYTTKRGDNVHTIIVQLPQLSVVPLGRPPERIAFTQVRKKILLRKDMLTASTADIASNRF